MVHIGDQNINENAKTVDDEVRCAVDISSSEIQHGLNENNAGNTSSESESLINQHGITNEERKKEIINTDNSNTSDGNKVQCVQSDHSRKSVNGDSYIPKKINFDDRGCCSNQNNEILLNRGWKKVPGENGQTMYVNLVTGNTSYSPPELRETIEWTSSQPLGAPPLKIPLTHEPWYNPPPGRAVKNREAITLTHGFSSFMSWKRRKKMKADLSQGPVSKQSGETDGIGEGNIPDNVDQCKALMPPALQEAIDSLLQDTEAEENSIKWSGKPPDLQQDKSEPSEVAQVCQLWEAPDFAMDADILSSELPLASTQQRGAAVKKGPGGVRIYNIVHPYKFTREMLQSCKVSVELQDCMHIYSILIDRFI